MRLIIKKPSADRMIAELASTPSTQKFISELSGRMRHGTDVDISIDFLAEGGLDELERNAAEASDRSIITQIGTYRRIIAQPRSVKISRLGHLEGAIVEWMLSDIIKGWVFKRERNGELLAWVVEDVKQTAGLHKDPSVDMVLSANIGQMKGADRSNAAKILSFYQTNLPGTVEELLADRGYVHETPELHREYQENLQRFGEVHAQVNAQFRLAPGSYEKAGRNGSYSDRDLVIGSQHRCVNDETLVERVMRDAAGRSNWDDRITGGKRKQAPGGPRDIPDDAFIERPTHFRHLVYDLDAHAHAWVPSTALTEYVYTPDKVNLLVLPEDHRELVEILTMDADVLIEDVVEGKTGGTMILLEGRPGLGKTLLAEVYAEKMEKVLYKIQAGQLGITPESVATGIVKVYENAARWGAVVLLDEADVYIRERDESMDHNAVVAALLVTFERQTAITFMATNRSDDVDEAIISRCIAVVHFDMPTAEASAQIWRIQAETIGINLDDGVIEEMVRHHRDKDGKQRASGRDIRALLKLAYRYQKMRDRTIDAELLKQLGAFKRL